MNSFHQTDASSAILDRCFAEKYWWGVTGRELDVGK